MPYIFRTLFITCLTFISINFAYAEEPKTIPKNAIDKPMSFMFAYNGGNCFGCEWIAAEGNITSETPAKLRNFLRKNTTAYLEINSKGGNLAATLEIGRIFRKHELVISTGKTWIDKNAQSYKDGFRYHQITDGICADTCAYAFLGGILRQPHASNFGISYIQPTNVSNQQIRNYFSEMSIKPQLAATIFDQAANHNYFPNSKELIAWGVDNITNLYSKPTLLAYGKNNGKIVETKHLSGRFANPQNPRTYRLYCRGKNKVPHFTILEKHTNNSSNPPDEWGEMVKHITTANIHYNNSIYSDTPVKVAAYHNGKNTKALAFELLDLPLRKFKDIQSISITLFNVPREYMFVINQLHADFGNINQQLEIALQHCIE